MVKDLIRHNKAIPGEQLVGGERNNQPLGACEGNHQAQPPVLSRLRTINNLQITRINKRGS